MKYFFLNPQPKNENYECCSNVNGICFRIVKQQLQYSLLVTHVV